MASRGERVLKQAKKQEIIDDAFLEKLGELSIVNVLQAGMKDCFPKYLKNR